MTMRYFLEERSATSSHWMPALYREKPALGKNMRIGMTNRWARSAPVQIDPKDYRMTLTQMQSVYGGKIEKGNTQ